jgi:hypothetical protein
MDTAVPCVFLAPLRRVADTIADFLIWVTGAARVSRKNKTAPEERGIGPPPRINAAAFHLRRRGRLTQGREIFIMTVIHVKEDVWQKKKP